MDWLSWTTAVVVAAVCAVYSRYYLHMFQLESYQRDGYRRWLAKNREKLTGWTLNIGVIATVVSVALGLLLNMFMGQPAASITATFVTLIGFVAAVLQLYRQDRAKPEKKPFALTPRMRRLYAALAAIALLACLLCAFLSIPVYLVFVGVAYLTLIAGTVMEPVEKRINQGFLNDARAKLDARDDLIKIGITGSFGKTSTKFALAAILSVKYEVLATPASFNTPMGLTRVIREQLTPKHQVFIAEMGARHVGDIRELCDLVHPTYGVITAVGEQHLETFGDVSHIADTKFELIEALPKDGAAFFAADDGLCDALFQRATCEKYRAGLGSGYLSMYAEDIAVGAFGSRFTLCDAEGARVRCETKLLGMHNIRNIVLACMVAKRLGLTMSEIARGVRRIKPVEHRLQLMSGANGMTIIDDAFNANPVGAAAALDVMRDFPGRRIVVTPGLVEQGEKENQLNKALGAQIAQSCDYAILIGKKRAAPILEGARAGGMPLGVAQVVSSLDEATAVLARIGKPGDVILFENDLPDNYSE